MTAMRQKITGLVFLGLVFHCNNNPYGNFKPDRSLYTNLAENPATLDPARIFDFTGNMVASNIYDTPFQFHYLKRPLTIEPSMASGMPRYASRIQKGQRIHSLRFDVRQDLKYAPDACHRSPEEQRIQIADFIFSIKRAADDHISPFGGAFLSKRVLGFDAFRKSLAKARTRDQQTPHALDPDYYLKQAYAGSIAGVLQPGEFEIEILMHDPYPQVLYFFTLLPSAPIPERCVWYYSNKNDSGLDRHTIASGPFQLLQWRDGHSLDLVRNPAYRTDDFFPELEVLAAAGSAIPTQNDFKALAGHQLPMLDSVHFQVISRTTARQILFEQGYLDIYSNRHDLQDRLLSSPALQEKFSLQNVRMYADPEPVTFGWSLNLNDPLLGKNVYLRRALALMIDRREFMRRFYPGRGQIAMGLLPSMIAGSKKHIIETDLNTDIKSTLIDSHNAIRKAQQQLVHTYLNQAGYAGGKDPSSGKSLRITLTDRAAQGRQAIYQFYIDQFAEFGLELKVEQLDFPALIEKKNLKNFQMIHFGWGADYPDAQNFFQLFYGPNASNPYNESSYQNSAFDKKYEKMARMPDSVERRQLIHSLQSMLDLDVPVIFLFHRSSSIYTHQWVSPIKVHPLHLNFLKYINMDAKKRHRYTEEWNQIPVVAYWIGLVLLVFFIWLLRMALHKSSFPAKIKSAKSGDS